MFYIIGSEDIFMRPPSTQASTSTKIQRQPKWTNWLESLETGWCRGLSEEEKAQKEEQAERELGLLADGDVDAMAVDSSA